VVDTIDGGKFLAQQALQSGKAWEAFRRLVITQGGDVSYIDHPKKLAGVPIIHEYRPQSSGFIKEIKARLIGEAAVILGAGRAQKGDPIDYSVGIKVLKKVGDPIEKNEPLYTIFANHQQKLSQVINLLETSYEISHVPVSPEPLFYGVIE
jgi:pyrimidine-nucleoside phosphorylase